MKSATRFILPFFAAVLLSQCGAPQPPQCKRVPMVSRAPAASLIGSAKTSWAVLADGSRKADWPAAEASYNAAVGKLFDQLRCGRGSWKDRAAAMGTTIFPAKRHKADPEEFYALFPAGEVKMRKEKQRHLTPGIGVALVGWKVTTPINVARPAAEPARSDHQTFRRRNNSKEPSPPSIAAVGSGIGGTGVISLVPTTTASMPTWPFEVVAEDV